MKPSTTLTALGVALSLATPAVASAELVWRAPLTLDSENIQITGKEQGVEARFADGSVDMLAGYTATNLGATPCITPQGAYLAVGVQREGASALWILETTSGRTSLVELKAPLAARPAASMHTEACVFGALTTDGSLSVVPAGASSADTLGQVMEPISDIKEFPRGMMFSAHAAGWLVGDAAGTARMVVDGAAGDAHELAGVALPGVVRNEDGVAWFVTREGALMAWPERGAPVEMARSEWAATIGLTSWPSVGVVWGDADGNLLSFNGSELTTTKISSRRLERPILTAALGEQTAALVPGSDGYLHVVSPDLTHTSAVFEAHQYGARVIFEKTGALIMGRKRAIRLADLVAPVGDMDDEMRAELLEDPSVRKLDRVSFDLGVEIRSGVLSAQNTTLGPPENIAPIHTVEDEPLGMGCSTSGTGPADTTPFAALALFGLFGFVRRNGRKE